MYSIYMIIYINSHTQYRRITMNIELMHVCVLYITYCFYNSTKI